jgi:hypothetical protein
MVLAILPYACPVFNMWNCEIQFCVFVYYVMAGVNAVSNIFLLIIRDIFR